MDKKEQFIQKILNLAAMPDEHGLSCDEVFSLVDEFTDMVVRGEDVSVLMPLVNQHIEVCPECREDYEALLRAVRNSSSG